MNSGVAAKMAMPTMRFESTSETLKIKDEEQLKLELESFADAIKGRKRPVVNGEDAREAIALGLEILRQMAEHRKTVLG